MCTEVRVSFVRALPSPCARVSVCTRICPLLPYRVMRSCATVFFFACTRVHVRTFPGCTRFYVHAFSRASIFVCHVMPYHVPCFRVQPCFFCVHPCSCAHLSGVYALLCSRVFACQHIRLSRHALSCAMCSCATVFCVHPCSSAHLSGVHAFYVHAFSCARVFVKARLRVSGSAHLSPVEGGVQQGLVL